MRILCVGLSHKTAPVALREQVAFDSRQTARALDELRAAWPEAEFLVLSTCNRTEIYCARPVHGPPRDEQLRDWLARQAQVHGRELAACLLALHDRQAVEHLYAVAAGLDSLVTGEAQIIAQVKQAYALACAQQVVGPVLNPLVQEALHVAKHVQSQTHLGQGRASVASVAIDLVARVLDPLRGKCALSVGAGKMSRLMLCRLRTLGAGPILIANRSADHARQLAAATGGSVLPLERLGQRLYQADLVLASTGSSTALISRPMVEQAQRRRDFRPMLLMDMGVPRDVDPQAAAVRNVHLYNIDDLEHVAAGSLALRDGQRAAAQAIIDDHVQARMKSLTMLRIAPTIEALYRRMDQLMRQELAQARPRLGDHADSQEHLAVLERTMRRTVRRVMHPFAVNLRRAAAEGDVSRYLAMIHDLFNLGGDDGKGQL
jgi:glutamyl-tRNA reductase